MLGADSKARIGWAPLANRRRERELVGGEGPSLLVDGAVGGVPLVAGHRPDLLERLSDELRRGVVVEDDPALGVNEDRGQRDDRPQVARKDQLERLGLVARVVHLRDGHAA